MNNCDVAAAAGAVYADVGCDMPLRGTTRRSRASAPTTAPPTQVWNAAAPNFTQTSSHRRPFSFPPLT
jgi:hypothetical protein